MLIDDDTPALRERLARIDGVDAVLVDAQGSAIALILSAGADAARVRTAAAATAGERWRLDLAFRPALRERERVRFVGYQRSALPDNLLEVRVTLEWDGEAHSGAATGERGGPLELRTAASATLAAIAAFLPPDIGLRLAGVKQVRAFDTDLIVVSIFRHPSANRSFVGAVVTGDDPARAASVAVLSALNRLLGNYLFRG
jgi:hypothetical protein